MASKKAAAALADRIKSSNFDYGSRYQDVRNRYVTTQNKTHNYQGDASKLKGALDPERAREIRINHFTIGGPTANTTTTEQK
jgi:hypothetical protein